MCIDGRGKKKETCWKVLSSIDPVLRLIEWTCGDRSPVRLQHVVDYSSIRWQNETKQWLSTNLYCAHAHWLSAAAVTAPTPRPTAIRIVFTVGYKCIGYCWNPFRILIDCEVILLDKRRTVLGKHAFHCSRTIVCIFKITLRAAQAHSFLLLLWFIPCRLDRGVRNKKKSVGNIKSQSVKVNDDNVSARTIDAIDETTIQLAHNAEPFYCSFRCDFFHCRNDNGNGELCWCGGKCALLHTNIFIFFFSFVSHLSPYDGRTDGHKIVCIKYSGRVHSHDTALE